MESPSFKTEIKPNLTADDIKDRDDFQYLLSIMEKQGASGVTQSLDYEDALAYKEKIEAFRSENAPEGPVYALFDDVIFDFDGVLYDSQYPHYKALQLTLDKYRTENSPATPNLEALANSYQAPYDVYYERFGIVISPEKRTEFKKEFRALQAQIAQEYPSRFYPEVKSVLDKLKEYKKSNPNLKIHIVSAGSEEQVKPVLEAGGVLDDFDEIHLDAHDKVTAIKSITEKRKAERTVMVGDLPSDIKDARKVDGVRVVAVARGEREQERLGMYLPDYIVTNLSGLLNLESFNKKLTDKSTE